MEWSLTEKDITLLFRAGAIDSRTECRAAGTERWLTINDHLPLLKWGIGPARGSGDQGAAETLPAGAPKHRRGIWPLVLISVLALTGGALVYCVPALRTFFTASPGRTYAGSPQREMPVIRARSYAPTYSVDALSRSPRTTSKPVTVPARSTVSRQYSVSKTDPIVVPPRPAYKAQPAPPEEVTIPLQRPTEVTTRYGSFWVEIVDHGPVTFSYRINDSRFRRIDKVKGFETTGTNITLIHRLSNADVYFVDRISVSVGYCVLKIVPRG